MDDFPRLAFYTLHIFVVVFLVFATAFVLTRVLVLTFAYYMLLSVSMRLDFSTKQALATKRKIKNTFILIVLVWLSQYLFSISPFMILPDFWLQTRRHWNIRRF
jgi:hypothetical protein